MIDVTKMEEALALAYRIDTLLTDAGVFDTGINTATSFQDFFEDLRIDIVRGKAGNLDDRDEDEI